MRACVKNSQKIIPLPLKFYIYVYDSITALLTRVAQTVGSLLAVSGCLENGRIGKWK